MRKIKNRMKFGPEAEVTYRDTGKGYGLLKIGGAGGKIKVSSSKNQKINTKKQKLLAFNEINFKGNKEGSNSGLTSSVVIEAPQGISLINPQILEKRIDESKNYFSNVSGFTSVQQSKKNNNFMEL